MSRPSAKSPQLMRRMNARLVARFALEVDDFTATDAMAATDLTRATVLGVCSDLVEAGWLEDHADTRVSGMTVRGRPAKRYALSRSAGTIVGVDADEHRCIAQVADLRGDILGASPPVALAGRIMKPENRLLLIREAIAVALTGAGIAADDVSLTVVGIPAPVDGAGHSPMGQGGFWNSMNVHLVDELAGPVIIDNDANLAAVAESTASTETPLSNVATLLTDERIGAGLIVDGRLLRGPRGGAGEMRFLRLMFPPEEALLGISALSRVWARKALADTAEDSTLRSIPPERLTARDVMRAAAEGDPLAARIATRLSQRLARVAYALGSLLDVEKVVVCGALATASTPVLAEARAILDHGYEAPVPELVASTLGDSVVVTGAIERGLARIHHDPLDFLPAR